MFSDSSRLFAVDIDQVLLDSNLKIYEHSTPILNERNSIIRYFDCQSEGVVEGVFYCAVHYGGALLSVMKFELVENSAGIKRITMIREDGYLLPGNYIPIEFRVIKSFFLATICKGYGTKKECAIVLYSLFSANKDTLRSIISGIDIKYSGDANTRFIFQADKDNFGIRLNNHENVILELYQAQKPKITFKSTAKSELSKCFIYLKIRPGERATKHSLWEIFGQENPKLSRTYLYNMYMYPIPFSILIFLHIYSLVYIAKKSSIDSKRNSFKLEKAIRVPLPAALLNVSIDSIEDNLSIVD